MVTVEARRLAGIEAAIQKVVRDSCTSAELRMQLLEAIAAVLGGFDLDSYQRLFDITPVEYPKRLREEARRIVRGLHDTGIHPALCLSVLARETLDSNSQRTNGAYHTDFRLAMYLAKKLCASLAPGIKVIDPACGAGILLVAISMQACRSDRIRTSDWIRNSVYAADISPTALRGTLLALSSLTDDLSALQEMRAKWYVQNSLLASNEVWNTMSNEGFDVVVANPPWERIKLTRHEYVKAKLTDRHYGSSYTADSLEGFESARTQKALLAHELVSRYPSLSRGETDLYIAFTELILRLTREGGHGTFLVPGGLIRSKNTEFIRRQLIESSQNLHFTLITNAARHFAIDTRFKFLVVNFIKAKKEEPKTQSIELIHASANDNEITQSAPVQLTVQSLRDLRPNLTLPEVRRESDWYLYQRMQDRKSTLAANTVPWKTKYCREVDMTHARSHFRRSAMKGYVPVIEGRMVQPHRLGCKVFVSGEGRSAIWRNLPPGHSSIKPQFWVRIDALSPTSQERISRTRVGFCDITGQTNERSMMASIVPAGFACGNKVPTIEFLNDQTGDLRLLWLAIVNSLPFDWLIRRVVTTTVNYFVLNSIRLPDIDVSSETAQHLIQATRALLHLDNAGVASFDRFWRIAKLRALLDVIVADAYGCDEDDLWIILDDFPLLDRGQPTSSDQYKSTVTTDLLINTWRRFRTDSGDDEFRRLQEAKSIGAIPYMSSEFALCAREFTGMSE